MTLASESYSEYFSYCDQCGEQVLRVIETVDLQEMDDKCGVCSECCRLFCGKCVVEKDDEIYCPQCKAKLMEFQGCSAYDLIGILEHNCQPFTKRRKVVGVNPNK